MVMRAPMAPSQVIFSPRVKNAKIIVTTGIRYKPQVTLTVPNILQALFQALKQKPLAIIPRKQRLNQLSGFEKRLAFAALLSVTNIDSLKPSNIVDSDFVIPKPASIRGIINKNA